MVITGGKLQVNYFWEVKGLRCQNFVAEATTNIVRVKF